MHNTDCTCSGLSFFYVFNSGSAVLLFFNVFCLCVLSCIVILLTWHHGLNIGLEWLNMKYAYKGEHLEAAMCFTHIKDRSTPTQQQKHEMGTRTE